MNRRLSSVVREEEDHGVLLSVCAGTVTREQTLRMRGRSQRRESPDRTFGPVREATQSDQVPGQLRLATLLLCGSVTRVFYAGSGDRKRGTLVTGREGVSVSRATLLRMT
ncbi:hypothetical protein MRX96_044518 [Rhipicephalus microplus]